MRQFSSRVDLDLFYQKENIILQLQRVRDSKTIKILNEVQSVVLYIYIYACLANLSG